MNEVEQNYMNTLSKLIDKRVEARLLGDTAMVNRLTTLIDITYKNYELYLENIKVYQK